MVGTVVVVIADGAADGPPGTPATALTRAATPNLDRLARHGTLLRARTIPPGLPPGSEVGIPTLLGVRPDRAPGRGFVEAAAAGVAVPAGSAAWRLDLHAARAPWDPPDPDGTAARLATLLGARVTHLRGHRFLLVGPAAWGDAPPPPHAPGSSPPPQPGGSGTGWPARLAPAARALPAGVVPVAWGAVSRPLLPAAPHLTVVAAPSGAAAGIARLLGARLVTPPGATGRPGSDLDAKAAAAGRALGDGGVVAVHVAAPDEAAHARDPATKQAAVEDLDARVVGPLAAAAARAGATLVVGCDHATDPASGQHLAGPVPVLVHRPGGRAVVPPAAGRHTGASRRLTEADVAGAPLVEAATILARLAAGRGAAA